MEASCPRCRAQLILPSYVTGQSVCCPKCRAVLLADSGRLIAPDLPTTAVPVRQPSADPERAAIAGDSQIDVRIPPGHVFPGQRHAEILRNLSWVGLWMRIVAAADLLSVFIVTALAHVPVHGHHADAGAAVGGVMCGLLVVMPLAVLLWQAGGALMEARLRGGAQQAALLIGLSYGVLGGLVALVSFLSMLAERLASELEFVAIFIVGAMGLATFLVSLVAVIVRRQAIISRVPERIDQFDDEDHVEPIMPPASPNRTPHQVARSAARSLRLASLVLVFWYPLSCCCASVRADVPHQAVYWVIVLWAAGLLPLALMLGGAYFLDELRRRAAVIAGGIAALLVSLGFAFDFLVHFAQLAGPINRHDGFVAFLVLSWAVSFAGALSSFIAGIQVLRAAGNPAVRREFARNR